MLAALASAFTCAALIACGGGGGNGGGGTGGGGTGGGGTGGTGGGGTGSSNVASISALSLNPTSVVAGSGSQGTVTLSSAPTVGTAVTLTSNSGAATVPGSVTVNSGATTAAFSVATNLVSASTPVTITGSLNGTQSATLTVTPAVKAVMTVKSLVQARRKSGGSQTVPIDGKGPGALDTCPLENVNNNPQLQCEFDGGPSTSPNPIVNYHWTWRTGNKQDSQSNKEAKFQPKVSDCGFFGGQSVGNAQQLQMVVELEITDSAGAKSQVMNQNVAIFPAGLCGYSF
jgi:hypothetical protein